jgi:uncharacterized protein (DUF2164 family)
MLEITFSKQERTAMTQKLQDFCDVELRQEISRFEAESLLGFIEEHIGKYFYNRGLYDAQTVLAKKIDAVSEEILSLEKATER